jgi:hypothetical protein
LKGEKVGYMETEREISEELIAGEIVAFEVEK